MRFGYFPSLFMIWLCVSILLLSSISESALWKPVKKIQEQQWVAEALGGIHQLLYVLLQIAPGKQIAQV